VEDLKQRVVRGGFVKIGAQVTAFAIRIGSMVAMARLLDPADFGIVAMVGAVAGVFTLLRDAGLSRATIQRDTVTEEQLSTLFWINTLLGVALAIAFAALAPVLVSFYREPRLFWISVALGFGFILNGLGVQHSALLERQLRFTAVSVIEIAALALSTAVAIVIAAAGFGYWSLVASSLVSPAVSSVGAWLLTGWVPRRPSRRAGVRSMLRFGGTVTLNSLIVYAAYNLDKVLLGRFAGADVLGLYGRAYQLASIPVNSLNLAIGGVAFAALSRLRSDPTRYRGFFVKGYSLVVSVTLPIAIGSAVFASDIVLIALGAKWSQVTPLLRFLAPTILVFAIINPLNWLLLSNDLAGRSLRMAMVIAPFVTVSYLVGLPYGAAGIALGFSATMALLVVPLTMWAVQDTPVTARDMLRSVLRPLLSGLLALVAAGLAWPLIGRMASPWLRLVLGGGVLLGVYAWCLLYLMGQKAFYVDLVRSMLGRRPAAAGMGPTR